MSRSDEVSVAEAQRWAREFVKERDWSRFHSPRNLAMALSVESAELLELYLWSDDKGPQPINTTREAQVAGEAADVFMCLLNFCDQAGVDLAKALEDKLVIARNKYPADRVKGSALKYDEYDEYTDEG